MECVESFLKIMFPSVTSGIEFRGLGSTGSRFKLIISRPFLNLTFTVQTLKWVVKKCLNLTSILNVVLNFVFTFSYGH